MKLLKGLKSLRKDESAIAGVEYALILALIGAAIATGLTILGAQSASNIDQMTTEVNRR